MPVSDFVKMLMLTNTKVNNPAKMLMLINTKVNNIDNVLAFVLNLVLFCWSGFFRLYHFIKRNYQIVNNASYIFETYLLFWQLNLPGFQIQFSSHTLRYFLLSFAFTSTFTVIPLLIWITFSTMKFIFTFAWYMFC